MYGDKCRLKKEHSTEIKHGLFLMSHLLLYSMNDQDPNDSSTLGRRNMRGGG